MGKAIKFKKSAANKAGRAAKDLQLGDDILAAGEAQIAKSCAKYFKSCIKKHKETQEEEQVRPFTLSGLCAYLGVNKKQFAQLVKTSAAARRAMLEVEAYLEEQMLKTGGVSAYQLILKNNFGWGEEETKPLNITVNTFVPRPQAQSAGEQFLQNGDAQGLPQGTGGHQFLQNVEINNVQQTAAQRSAAETKLEM